MNAMDSIRIRRILHGCLHVRQVPVHGYLTRGEASEALGVSVRWVYRLIELGRLRTIRRHGRVVIPVQEVLSYRKR